MALTKTSRLSTTDAGAVEEAGEEAVAEGLVDVERGSEGVGEGS